MSRQIWHPSAPPNRLGKRGRCLLAFGLFDLGYAWVMFATTPAGQRNSSVFRWFSSLAPMSAWGVLWAAVGAICIYHAFHHYDRFGYIAAIGIKVLWGLLSGAGWVLEAVPPLYVVSWPMVAYVVWTISGWREPDHADREVS